MNLRKIYEKKTGKFAENFHHRGLMEWEEFTSAYVIWLERQLTRIIKKKKCGKT